MTINCNYVSATSLTISGTDYTEDCMYGRRLICDCGIDDDRVVTITNSSWSSPLTTVNMIAEDSHDLTTNLESLRFGPGLGDVGSVSPYGIDHNLLLNYSAGEHFTKASISGVDVSLDNTCDSSYGSLQDWFDVTQSVGRITGGTITQHTDTVTGVTAGGAGSGEFKISGDHTTVFSGTLSISISESTGNDGQYTLSAGGSTHTGGTTTIPVDEAVSDSTIDGLVHNGRCNVAAGSGIIKVTESDIGPTKAIDWEEETNINLALVDTSYIYICYEDCDTLVLTTTDESDISNYTCIKIGICYRSNGIVYPLTGGEYLPDFFGRTHRRIEDMYGIKRCCGGDISEYGTRNIQSTAGSFYRGLNRLTTEAKTSTVDYFTSVYYDGTNWIWTQSQTQIDNTQYNNTATGLAELANSKYGIHWICIDYAHNLFSIYGDKSYTLTEAQNAAVPTLLPVVATEFGIIAAKIIIYKGASSFTEVISAYTTVFPSSSPAVHNDLSGIQGGASTEYYHLTSSDHTEATRDATNSQNGLMPTGKLTYWDAAYTHSQATHGDTDADNTAANETSHTDVVVDGDFTSDGFMKRSGAGSYTIDSASYSVTSHTHNDLYYTETEVDTISGALNAKIDGNTDYGTIITVSGTYKGSYMTVTVDDSASVFGTPLYCAPDFHYEQCCADSTSTMECVGIALEGSTGAKKILLEGQICDTAWNWDAGSMYISTTSGTMTQTVLSETGEQLQKVGFALSADTIYFRPDNSIVEIS